MDLALHQHIDLARTGKRDGLFGGGMAMGHVNDFNAGQIAARILGRRFDFCAWSDQNRNDDAFFTRLNRAFQRRGITGVNDGSRHGGQGRCRANQFLEPATALVQMHLGQHHAGAADFGSGGHDQRLPLDDGFALLVRA